MIIINYLLLRIELKSNNDKLIKKIIFYLITRVSKTLPTNNDGKKTNKWKSRTSNGSNF